MNGKGRKLLVGWGFRGRKYGVSATEFFEDVHTHNTSEQIREDIWTNWFFGAFLDQETTRYTVSAQSVGLKKGYLLQVDAGSYSATSHDAGLSRAFTIQVTNAGFTTTVNDAGLITARTLPVSVQSYTVLPHDTGLKAARRVSVTDAGYSITAYDVTLTKGGALNNYTLPVDYSGSTVTAQGVSVLLGRKLQVNGTELSVSSEAGLRVNRVINIAQNSYNVSANNTNLYKGFNASIDALIVNATANDIGFLRSYRLPFSGSYLMTAYELRGGIRLTKPATVVNEATTTADVVTEKTLSTTITTQVVL